MIAPCCDAGQGTQASFVAHEFTLDEVPEGGFLHVSALGLYRCFLNGQRVGRDPITPGWTCYDDRIAYQSYPLDGLLQSGTNRLEIWLGDGWYRSQMLWEEWPIVNCWGERIGAIAEIATGADVIAASDASWRSGPLPILRSGIYHGEDFDARIDIRDTEGVEVLDIGAVRLVPHEVDPVREMSPRAPVERWVDEEGGHVLDFGQNTAAYLAFEVSGPAGARVRAEHSEVIGPERSFDNRNYRSARAELVYTLRGEGRESYRPHFTFMGFRYARVTLDAGVELHAVEMIPISSVPTATAGFACGVPAVNRLLENTVWSQRANFIEIPTDCPQRDERMGWTGDAQVFAGTACWLADSERFLGKYLREVMHDQRESGAISHFSPDPTRLHPVQGRGDWAGSTGWGDVITVVPWQLYLHYGETAVLRECFDAMLRWVDYLWSLGDGPLVPTHSRWGEPGFTFGDWLQPVGDDRKPRPTIGDDCAATLYHFISTDLAARIAGVLGEKERRADLERRAESIRAAFRHEYFSASGRLAHNDQTSYALAFLHDLVPPEHAEAAARYFEKVIVDAEYLIGTGFIGTPALLPALSKIGRGDLAERIFLNTDVPGWLYQVERGATSIWERWDAIGADGTIHDPEMNSFNHYAYGAVCQWLFEQVAGVSPDPEHPGFEQVLLAPDILPALAPVSAWHECRQGRIECAWTLEGRRVSYTVSLPAGTSARWVCTARHRDLRIGGEPIDATAALVPIPSGRHTLTFELIDRESLRA